MTRPAHRTRRLLPIAAAGSAVLLLSSAAQAADVEKLKIAPSVLQADDVFGGAIATDSATLLVGAERDAARGTASGTAYLVSASTGRVLRELRPVDARPDDDTADGDLFGDRVALDNGLALVGAPNSGDAGRFAGAAYVYEAASGRQLARLLPFQEVFVGETPDGGGFGVGLDLSANRIAVGAPGDLEHPDGTSLPGIGAVYLYSRAATTGPRFVDKVKPNDPTAAANFGYRVALTDRRLAVAAPFDGGFNRQSGSVYLLDPLTGRQKRKVVPPDLSPFDFFGLGLDLSDAALVVGAPGADNVGQNAGAVYVLDPVTGQQRYKLVPPDPSDGAQFGWSVAVDGTRILVGAPGAANPATGAASGAVYVYDVATGRLLDRLAATDEGTGDGFGFSVTAADGLVAVGAPFDDDRGVNAGAVSTYGAEPTVDRRVLVSFRTDGGGVGAEDIVEVDPRTGALTPFFDGSDVGLGASDVDAFALLADRSVLLSLRDPATVAGLAVDDSDILRFVPTSTGSVTAGTFSLYVDGSDVGLTTDDEDVDAIEVLYAGRAVAVSTTGPLRVPELAAGPSDLALLELDQTGPTTAGVWSTFFDGSDVGLSSASENLGDVAVVGAELYLTTAGPFSVPRLTGDNRDVLRCTDFRSGAGTRCTFRSELDGSALGLRPLDGLSVEPI